MSDIALERSRTYFEQFVQWCPEPLRGVASAVTETLAWPLELVAGDPDELITAAQGYRDIAVSIRDIATEHADNVTAVQSSWSGAAATAFAEAMAGFGDGIGDLAGGFDQLQEILVEAANASVEAFNLILEIILEVILFLVTEFILAAAAAALSFGASLVAAGVAAFARLAHAMGRISSIILRLSQLLARLAARVAKVAEFLARYAKKILELRQAKKAYSPFKRALYTSEGAAFKLEYMKWVIPGKIAFGTASPVGLPGPIGIGLDGVAGYRDVADGTKDRNYVMDGTYHDVTGRYTKPIQDIIDSVQ